MPYEICNDEIGYEFTFRNGESETLPQYVVGKAPIADNETWTLDTGDSPEMLEWIESCQQYFENSRAEVIAVRPIKAVFGRWTLGSGYLDCSDWQYAETEEELLETLKDDDSEDDNAETAICPICGTTLTAWSRHTTDGRLIGYPCGDAFTQAQFEKEETN